MQKKDSRDLAALEAAKAHMGRLAWPTVILGLAIFTSYLVTPLLVISGSLSLAPAVAVMAALTYAAYTVLHEAVHGTISGSHTRWRWLNELMGYMAAWVLMIPLTAHRHEHLAHHRNTNSSEDDPDFVVADMARSPVHAVRAALRVYLGQYRYYMQNRWNKGPRSQNLYLCLEVAAALIPRLAFIAAGFWVEGIALFGLAAVLGIAALMFLFAYIVHTPHQAAGRYVDTSTIIVPGQLGRMVTFLWGFQNYHSIHHLFPRVPFYRMRELFGEIEDIMIVRGAPVYRLTLCGLRPYSNQPATCHQVPDPPALATQYGAGLSERRPG